MPDASKLSWADLGMAVILGTILGVGIGLGAAMIARSLGWSTSFVGGLTGGLVSAFVAVFYQLRTRKKSALGRVRRLLPANPRILRLQVRRDLDSRFGVAL